MRYIVFVVLIVSVISQSGEQNYDEPKVGGYQQYGLEDALKLVKFIKDKVQLRQEQKLVKYEKQVVNGFNHMLTYQYRQERIKIMIYESIEGDLSEPVLLTDENRYVQQM